MVILSGMTNSQIAADIGQGGVLPFPTDGIAPGAMVVVGRSPKGGAGNLGQLGTYLGHTLDGYVVVRIHGSNVDHGHPAGVGVEEWLPSQMRSFDSVVAEFVANGHRIEVAS